MARSSLWAGVSTCACMCVRQCKCCLMARLTGLGRGPVSREVADTVRERPAPRSALQAPRYNALFFWPI